MFFARFISIVVLVLIFSPLICKAEENVKIESEKPKVSYSVGYQVGHDFKRQGINIKPDMLIQGIQDALAAKEPVISHEEMRGTLADLQKKILEIQKERNKERAEQNMIAGRTFLLENGKKDGVITLPSGLQYMIISEGTGNIPKADDMVTVHYRGSLIDGTEFESSYERGNPASFRVNQVIAGWKEALLMMKEGSKWQLFIPSSLAYGDKTMGRIEPNSTLIFVIELIAVKSTD